MDYQGFGIGSKLLKYILRLAISQKEQFGCFGIVVDAKEESVAFYRQYGFEAFDIVSGALDIRPYAQSMFLSTRTIEKSLET